MVEAMGKRTKQLQEEHALQQALLNNPELQYQHAELKKQKEAKQIKLQSEQLTKRFDDQMVEVNALLASIPGGKPIIKAVKATASVEVANATHSTITELADENSRKTLITNMIQLIHSRRKKMK